MFDIELERSYHSPFANSPWLPLLLISCAGQRHSPDTKKTFRPQYDYIIVGGGSAGSVLAGRLSEVECADVLLLEAGPRPPHLTEVPVLAHSFLDTDVNWGFKTEPQARSSTIYEGKRVTMPRGKMLGGCSCHNGMQYTTGARGDYDRWCRGGAAGWGYPDVLPYFKKLEGNTEPECALNGYHGVDGPVTVGKQRYESETRRAILDAFAELDYGTIDSNGPQPCCGVYEMQTNTRDGQRCSAAKAYLVPAENRTNLDILTNAMVTKVDIVKGRARGVVFEWEGSRHYVEALREVILCGGTYGSAQLLLLSGVGPADHLREMGIQVKADLPVGQNYHDHCGLPVLFALDGDVTPLCEKISDARHIQDYIDNKRGPLSFNGIYALGYVQDAYRDPSEPDSPDLQVAFSDFHLAGFKRNKAVMPEIYEKVYQQFENQTLFACFPLATRPLSRGHVRLRSTDPFEAPLIDPNFLAHERDLDHLVEGCRFCHQIAETAPMRRLGARPLPIELPGCEGLRPGSEAHFRCTARASATSAFHPAGTCKMGALDDPTTVLDSQLRVKGVSGLRVVDASVMPALPSANINAPVMMIAEKAADFLKAEIVCHRPADDARWSSAHAYASV